MLLQRSFGTSFSSSSRKSIGSLVNTFLIPGNYKKSHLYSTTTTTTTTPSSSRDAMTSSRRPFRSPKFAPDDSNIKDTNNKNRIANANNIDNELQWNKLGLMTDIVRTIKDSLGYMSPTSIQKLTIPRLLSKEHIAFGAATGSGKTLAYLLPMIQSLKAEEMDIDNNSTASSLLRRAKRPRAVILAPTRELVEQIVQVIKILSHGGIKISSTSLVGGEDAGKQRKKLQSNAIDILVATPGRFVKRLKDGHMFIGSVRYIVIDEIDTMLEQGFQNDIAVLLNGVPDIDNNTPQVIVTTATMTNAVKRILQLEDAKPKKKTSNATPLKLPQTLRFIQASGLHRAVPRLNQIFIDVGSTDKVSLLFDILHSSYTSKNNNNQPKTLIFCNTISSCRAVEHELTEAGISCLSYHGDLGSTMRNENVKIFKSSSYHNTLICTDIASRGLDIPTIEHIIMFDFPLNPIDYLHRSGRTARGIDGTGKVTALIAKRDKVLAMAIENAVLKGMPLDSLSSRKSDYLPGAKIGSNKSVAGANRNYKNRNNSSFDKKRGDRYSNTRKDGHNNGITTSRGGRGKTVKSSIGSRTRRSSSNKRR